MGYVSVAINNDSASFLTDGSFSFQIGIAEPGRVTLTIRSDKYIPVAGHTIGLYDDGVRFYGGFVNEVTKRRLAWDGTFGSQIQCVSWEYAYTKRQIGFHRITGKNAGDCVRELIDKYGTDEVFQVGQIDDGATAEELGTMIFRNMSLAEALDELATRSNKTWWFNPDGIFYFSNRDLLVPTGITIDENDFTFRNPEHNERVQDYFNAVVIEYPVALVSDQEETFFGDGTTRSWTLPSYIEEILSIEVDGIPADVGILNEDTDMDFYYEVGGNVIYQESADPPFPSEEILIKYKPMGENYYRLSLDDEIAARAAIEGSSGRYEALIQDDESTTIEAVQNKANKFLDAHCPSRNGAPLGTILMSYKFVVDSRNHSVLNMLPGSLLDFEMFTSPNTQSVRPVMVNSLQISYMRTPGMFTGSPEDGVLVYTLDVTEYINKESVLGTLKHIFGGGGSASGGSSGAETKMATFVIYDTLPGNDVTNSRPIDVKGVLKKLSINNKYPTVNEISIRIKILRGPENVTEDIILDSGDLIIPAASPQKFLIRKSQFAMSPVQLNEDDFWIVDILSGDGTAVLTVTTEFLPN